MAGLMVDRQARGHRVGSDAAERVQGEARGETPDLRDGVPADVMAVAGQAFGLDLLRGTVRHGNGAETAGFATNAGTWIRFQWRRHGVPVGRAWAGLEAASALGGVRRPELLRSFRWTDARRDLVWRAEEMTLVMSPVLAPGGSVLADPGLPDTWWASLRGSLSALAGNHTSKTSMSQEHLSRRIAEVYGDAVDTAVAEWATAHADLHWGNLTAPECWILDWPTGHQGLR
jgi:hypothetical protein